MSAKPSHPTSNPLPPLQLPSSIFQHSTSAQRADFGSFLPFKLALKTSGMALIQSALIWVVYAVVLALIVLISSIFVYVYQSPRERSVAVTIVCIFTLTSLLATVLLLPVDVALVSSTTSSKLGRRKDWATQNAVDNITYTLRIVNDTL